MNIATETQSDQVVSPRMTPLRAFIALVAVVGAFALFLTICHFVGIRDSEHWIAFLFVTYWAGIQLISKEQLPSTVVGAAVGLLLVYLFQQSSAWFGSAGGVIFLGAILVAIYFQIMGWLSIAINMSTMLYLTVGTIPQIQSHFDFTSALLALTASVAYFAGPVWAAALFKKTKQPAT